eukprot:gb/GECG01000415.1/.p1 GENE.gb/GECG01000415.1/~~gb/GECG01000415.1/.p1  ORF type:complete len:685 (+),score=51.60 gb/GECG01000415.1/:1-2055(+)
MMMMMCIYPTCPNYKPLLPSVQLYNAYVYSRLRKDLNAVERPLHHLNRVQTKTSHRRLGIPPEKEMEPLHHLMPIKTTQDPPNHGPQKFFPISTAVEPDLHYHLIPTLWSDRLQRVVPASDAISQIVARRGEWFRIYGPRQSGKTTALTWAAKALHQTKKYVCVYWNLQSIKPPEVGPENREVKIGFDLDLLTELMYGVRAAQANGHLREGFDSEAVYNELLAANSRAGTRVRDYLTRLAQFVEGQKKQTLVIFVDEVDSLATDKENAPWMNYFLETLRMLHNNIASSTPAPSSIGLCALYDISQVVPRSSPFNNVNRWLHPVFWNKSDLQKMLQQYADDSGRIIENDVVEAIMYEVAGYPWFCNYIMSLVADIPDANPVKAWHVKLVVQQLYRRRVSGISSLETRLKHDLRLRNLVMKMSLGLVPTRDEEKVGLELGVIREVEEAQYDFSGNMIRECCFRWLADDLETTDFELNEARKSCIKHDNVDWEKMMERFLVLHMHPCVALVLRHLVANKRRTSPQQNIFNWLERGRKDVVREEFFTDLARCGYARLLNGDSRGMVITEQPAEDGKKPDCLLHRTLNNSIRVRAIVEHKLARPLEVNQPVDIEEINKKMEEAVKDLAAYYRTYRVDTHALLAVVYAPSAATPNPQFKQFSCSIIKDEKRFGDVPVYKIVFRIDLGPSG